MDVNDSGTRVYPGKQTLGHTDTWRSPAIVPDPSEPGCVSCCWGLRLKHFLTFPTPPDHMLITPDPALSSSILPVSCLCVCVFMGVCVFRWPTWCRWRVTACQAPSLCTTPTACPPLPPRPPPPGLPCPGRTPTLRPTPLLPCRYPAWRPPSTSWTVARGCGRMTTCHPRFLHAAGWVLPSECAWAPTFLFFLSSVVFNV